MSKPIQKNHKKLYIWIASLALAIPLILFAAFILFALQIPQYSYYYAKCGFKEPVKVVGRNFAGDMLNYASPLDSGYKDYTLTVRGYFCTENEAQRAGLKNIDKDGWFNPESTPYNQVKW